MIYNIAIRILSCSLACSTWLKVSVLSRRWKVTGKLWKGHPSPSAKNALFIISNLLPMSSIITSVEIASSSLNKLNLQPELKGSNLCKGMQSSNQVSNKHKQGNRDTWSAYTMLAKWCSLRVLFLAPPFIRVGQPALTPLASRWASLALASGRLEKSRTQQQLVVK